MSEVTSVKLNKRIIGQNILQINYGNGQRIFELKGDRIQKWCHAIK